MLKRFLFLLLIPVYAFAQDTASVDSSSFFLRSSVLNKKRTVLVAGTEAALAGGSLLAHSGTPTIRAAVSTLLTTTANGCRWIKPATP
ncbi:MAG: hypothetical protein FD123_684 [Bacteroidetes bacterium]|nr:MAG: hypothetical protein FD123_684 [Bacteroidota bacterium]